ncbi:MAG: nitroreductase family deazaflavin-dependent oxidoreductase [Acidimicrobiia bacterium]|jgi:deazaflavin-dependent oxidoreductase (nitroreductase family)
MFKGLAKGFGGLLLILSVVGIAFMIGLRTKYPPLLTAVRKMNRAVMNPRAMKTAGQPGAYAGVVRHVGRKSGTPYETPVGPFPTDHGFDIALPYGSSPDWLKNVVAAGSAVIVHEGVAYSVDQPELIPAADAMDNVPPSERRNIRVFAVDNFLRVRRVGLHEGE